MHAQRSFGVILGGASCTGKTYLLRHARSDFPHLRIHDMDRERYYRPEVVRERLPEYARWLEQTIDSKELLDDVGASEPRVRLPKIALLRLIADGRPFLTSCGSLPPPGDAYYERIRRSTGLRLFHVLLDPSRRAHLLRILLRFRLARATEFRSKQLDQGRFDWDARVHDLDGLTRFLHGVAR